MARNGSGTYSLPSGNPVVTGTVISSTTHNNTNSDIASALTQSVSKDGQTTMTGNLPMGGFKITGAAVGTASTDYATVSQIASSTGSYVSTVGGTADAITLTPSPAITAYAAGQRFTFIASGANTTAVTVNVSSLGAKSITKNGATALTAGDIQSASVVDIEYDGTQFQIKGIGSSSGTQTIAGDKTFSGANTHSGANTFSGRLDAAADFRVSGDITPSQITADQDDYSPTGLSTASVLRLDSDATRAITGLAGGADGRIVTLMNIGSFIIRLPGNSSSSSAANRWSSTYGLSPGQALTFWYDSTSSLWRCKTSQMLVPIDKKTASTSATLDFVSGIVSEFDDYIFCIVGIIPSTNNTVLWMRVSEDAGSTWEADASDYAFSLRQQSSVGTEYQGVATAAAQVALITTIGASGNAGAGIDGDICLYRPSAASTRKRFRVNLDYDDSNGNQMYVIGSGAYTDGATSSVGTAAINGVRFLSSSGNLESGSISLFARRKS